MRRLVGIILTALLLVSLAACASEAVPEATPTPISVPTEEPAAQFALPRTASTLHPILGNDRTNLTLSPLLWEGLFELDNTFTPQNILCVRSAVSEDALIWTFTLRTDVAFSDGSALTAADAAQSLQLAMGTGTRYTKRLSGVKSIAATDEHTLTVTLKAPNGNFPALLDIPIVKGESEEPLGTGPYVMENRGQDARLLRRADWWRNESLPLETIPLLTVEGADNLIYAFDTNDISLVTTDLTGTNALGYSTGYEAWDNPTSIMLFVGFNAKKGPCEDALVRQALSRSFDRATVTTGLYARHAQGAVLPVSPASPLYDTALAQELDYSTQAAADLLTQAGYLLTDGVLKRNRAALALTFLVNSENAFKIATAEYLAGELGKLGIAVELQKLGWTDYENALAAGEFDLYLGETMLTADFDLTELIAQTGVLNYGKYNNGETTALMAAFQSATGQARAVTSAALYRKLGEEAPFTPLCFKNSSVLTKWGMMSGLSPTRGNAFYGLSGWTLNRG